MEVRKEEQNEDKTWKPARLILVDYLKSDAAYRKVYLTEEVRNIFKKYGKLI